MNCRVPGDPGRKSTMTYMTEIPRTRSTKKIMTCNRITIISDRVIEPRRGVITAESLSRVIRPDITMDIAEAGSTKTTTGIEFRRDITRRIIDINPAGPIIDLRIRAIMICRISRIFRRRITITRGRTDTSKVTRLINIASGGETLGDIHPSGKT